MDNTKNTPTVGVVIPVYCSSEEHEVYLKEALKSVACQSFKDYEVIIVDDCSPRDISPILERVDGIPALKVIRNETNQGHARSRNNGVLATDAEMVAFLDHDDLWSPEKLERQVEALRESPDADMVFCKVKVFGPHASRQRTDQSILPERPSFVWFFFHGNYVLTATAALVRRQALVDIGLFDPRYTTSDDFDAWLKILLRRRKIVYQPEELAHYRLHSMNINYGVDRLNDTNLLLALYWKYWLSARLREKLVMLPRLMRKTIVNKPYFYIFRRRRFWD